MTSNAQTHSSCPSETLFPARANCAVLPIDQQPSDSTKTSRPPPHSAKNSRHPRPQWPRARMPWAASVIMGSLGNIIRDVLAPITSLPSNSGSREHLWRDILTFFAQDATFYEDHHYHRELTALRNENGTQWWGTEALQVDAAIKYITQIIEIRALVERICHNIIQPTDELLGPAKNGAISAGVGQRQRRRLICDGSIGGDAVGTLHQTLHHLRGADRSGFLKIGAQTFLGGDDFPAALLPVLSASVRTFQTPSRPSGLQSTRVSGCTAGGVPSQQASGRPRIRPGDPR